MATLVIAEKPSVASDIAKALGNFKKDGNFWISADEEMVIGSAVGHLLEIQVPEEYDVVRGKWTFKALPVIPPYFELKPIKKTQEKLKDLAKMIRSAKITELVNACDAGREGELIFKYIVQACKSKKPIKRLWLQSMTKDAIRTGFKALKENQEMLNLEDAARCRSEADWLVGINATRAMTAFNSKEGGFFLTTVGRVQTPTLALVVRRENEIRAFVPKPYWTIRAAFGVDAGQYEGVWIDSNFKKDKNNADLKQDRLWDKNAAERIVAECAGKTGIAEETSKRTRQTPPSLFDLTSLQREANSRFGFSAKTTLSIAQSLYEKHKVLTYPRTDARALPEDYIPTVNETLRQLSALNSYELFSQKVLAKDWVVPDKRVFNNVMISDHFAIIPTGQLPKALSEAEQKIYDLVVRRFISQFFPAAEYDVTTRITTVEGHQFKTEGKVLIVPGWLEVMGKSLRSNKDEITPLKQQGEKAHVNGIELEAQKTRPPARYTEATLLTAMETAGRQLDDEELRDIMADKGLGTPATRAATIEGLIEQKYMRREERELIPTPKAFQLFVLLRGLKVNVLTDPRMTAEWEHSLKMIEEGKESRTHFMEEISKLTENIVESAKRYEGNSVPIENPIHIKAACPQCGGKVVETYRRYACTNPTCQFSIPKQASGRVLDPEEVETLITDKHIGPLTGFISRRGFPFDAELRLVQEDGLWQFKFDFGEDEAAVDLTEDDVAKFATVGVCPMCGSEVKDTPTGYCCEKGLIDSAKKKCSFRMGKTILSRDMTPEEVEKLLREKKSQLLTGFVSKRRKRTFSAFLVVGEDGNVGFEFPPREEGAASGAAKKTTRRTTKRTSSKE